MISKNEQKRLKKILGHHYAKDVLQLLNEKGITNKFGVPHNLEYIRMVFQGYRKNQDIEKAIVDLAVKRKDERESIRKNKTNLYR
jgi:hypothetical protein